MHILKEKKFSKYLWRNIHLRISWVIIFVTLLILGVAVYILGIELLATFGFRSPYTIIALAIIPISYVLGIFTYRQYTIWASGSEGENKVTRELKNLDDDYYLINGAVVPPNLGDTDHIVLGKNGIFVIETKNVSGEVICNGDQWSRKKTGRKGTPYGVAIGNPGNQVKRNAKVLKDLMIAHKNEIFNICGDGVISLKEIQKELGLPFSDNRLRYEHYEINIEKMKTLYSVPATASTIKSFLRNYRLEHAPQN